jgi:hypothetical protein
MSRSLRLILLVIVFAALLLGAAWIGSWGALALLLVTGGGLVWYRVQVARTEAAEQFFGDLGEETRLTGFQGGSPSEMPVDRQPPRPPAPPAPPGRS